MNNIAAKLQKCCTRKIAFKIILKNAKATKFLLQSAFYISKGSTCKVYLSTTINTINAINTIYVDPLLFDLSTLVWPETSDLNELVEFISDLLLKNSLPLAAPRSSRSSRRK